MLRGWALPSKLCRKNTSLRGNVLVHVVEKANLSWYMAPTFSWSPSQQHSSDTVPHCSPVCQGCRRNIGQDHASSLIFVISEKTSTSASMEAWCLLRVADGPAALLCSSASGVLDGGRFEIVDARVVMPMENFVCAYWYRELRRGGGVFRVRTRKC